VHDTFRSARLLGGGGRNGTATELDAEDANASPRSVTSVAGPLPARAKPSEASVSEPHIVIQHPGGCSTTCPSCSIATATAPAPAPATSSIDFMMISGVARGGVGGELVVGDGWDHPAASRSAVFELYSLPGHEPHNA
jgi:hypothetical protein